MNSYYPGNSIRLSANYKVANADADPGTVTLKVKGPLGTAETFVYLTDVALIKDSVGDFHYDYTATTAGIYHYRWEGTAPAKGAEENSFTVLESEF
jgi:hypothetical protein